MRPAPMRNEGQNLNLQICCVLELIDKNPSEPSPDHAPLGPLFAHPRDTRAPPAGPTGPVCRNSQCNAFGVDLPRSAAQRGTKPRRSSGGWREAERDSAEQAPLGAAGRQLDADAREVFDHARADLDQALADSGELSLCE